jgi:hypothetical protein
VREGGREGGSEGGAYLVLVVKDRVVAAHEDVAQDPDRVGEGDEPKHALVRRLVVEDVIVLLDQVLLAWREGGREGGKEGGREGGKEGGSEGGREAWCGGAFLESSI